MNTNEAKDFLVEQAAQQAALDRTPLSDLERRMMYFTESDPASCGDPFSLNDGDNIHRWTLGRMIREVRWSSMAACS